MFPFNNYKKVFFGPINAESGALIYTTTALSIIYFLPYGPYMEDDTEIRIYANDVFTDSDGGKCDAHIWRSVAGTSTSLDVNRSGPNFGMQGVLVPAGKGIYARVGDNSDKIGGTLYILELPAI